MISVLLAGCAGLILGSFANVVVHRVPRGESVLRPGSRCPTCSAPVRPVDNVPVLSWLLLHGRCRQCGTHVSLRYPLVELLTGVLFALAAARLPDTDLVAYLPLFWVLVVLSFIDLEHKLLPNRVVLPSIIAGAVLLGVSAALDPGLDAWTRALLAGAASFGVFLLLAIISPRGMGMGDVKLAPVLGMAMGYLSWPRVFVGFFLAFVFGAVGGLILIAARRAGMKSEVPFGPFMALGTTVSVLWGAPLVRAWLGA